MFDKAVREHPDRPAYINMGQILTFRKLEERSRAFAAYLQNEFKLQRGDRVALMMPNLLQYPIALFGILRAGLIAVNVNPLYTPRELEQSTTKTVVRWQSLLLSNFCLNLRKSCLQHECKTCHFNKNGGISSLSVNVQSSISL